METGADVMLDLAFAVVQDCMALNRKDDEDENEAEEENDGIMYPAEQVVVSQATAEFEVTKAQYLQHVKAFRRCFLNREFEAANGELDLILNIVNMTILSMLSYSGEMAAVSLSMRDRPN